MSGTIYKFDRTGHGEVAKWGDDAESRAAGAKVFAELAAKRFTMFEGGAEGRKLDAFDPEVVETIACPRLQAG